MADKPITIDMTDAAEIGPLDATIPYIFAISKWDYGEKNGEANVAATFDVVKPEGINQKVFDTINLINKNTKTRAINILAATGEFGTKEDIKGNKKFQMPKTEEMMGLQFGATVKTRGSEQFGDRSEIRRCFTVEVYEEQVAEASGV